MKFTLFWLDGKKETIEGETFKEALGSAGLQKGSLTALDFYCEGNSDNYIWEKGKWINKEIRKLLALK